MIYLKYKCKVNFVKLPLIWTDLCLKLVFENATAGRNTGCRSVVNCAGCSYFPLAEWGVEEIWRKAVVKHLKILHFKKCLRTAQCHYSILWCEKQIFSRYHDWRADKTTVSLPRSGRAVCTVQTSWITQMLIFGHIFKQSAAIVEAENSSPFSQEPPIFRRVHISHDKCCVCLFVRCLSACIGAASTGRVLVKFHIRYTNNNLSTKYSWTRITATSNEHRRVFHLCWQQNL